MLIYPTNGVNAQHFTGRFRGGDTRETPQNQGFVAISGFNSSLSLATLKTPNLRGFSYVTGRLLDDFRIDSDILTEFSL